MPHPPLDHDRPDGAVLSLDGNTDKGLWLSRGYALAPIRKQRTLCEVAHDQRHAGDDNLPDGLFWKPFKILLRGGFTPAGSDHRCGFALFIQKRDQTIVHLQKTGQKINNLGERHLHSRGARKCLRYLVNAGQGRVRAAD